MPDDDARKEAGERLAADLRSKREERGLSTDDLQKKLGVSSGLFQAYESGRLIGHPMFNRVYLRSLTRSYAGATGVSASAALAALESTLQGEYEEGQLQREIDAQEQPPERAGERTGEETGEAAEEGEQSETPPEEQASEGARASESSQAAAGAGTAAAASQEPDWTTQSPPGASAAEAEERQREKEEQAHTREREKEERAQQQQRERETRAGQQQERTGQRQQQAPRQQRTGRADRSSRRSRRSGSNASSWIVGALVLVALAVGGFFLIQSLGGGAETETAQTAVADTAAGGEQAAQQDQRPAANLQLGETMNFTVVAQGGPVRDLKVTRDQDVRRPYWIEQGQATVFPARQRIIIENPPEGQPALNNVQLLAEGYPYPTDRRDEQGRIVITREALQAFADTLRGQPVQPPAQPDTAALSGLP